MVHTEILASLSKVPPFPPVAARLLALLADESVEISAITELIGSDPMLSARLLQCVNSVEFNLASPVHSIGQALMILGLDRTRETTITVATAAYAKGALRTKELRVCWEHTLATAIIADQIAHACEAFTAVAYTAGIIHDIGRLGLLVAHPHDYERIIRDAAAQCLDLLDFESERFGIHHAEAGRLLAERWKLPEDFQVIAGRHHDPCEGQELDLLRVVHVACRLADVLGYAVTKPLVAVEIDTVLADLPEQARARLQMSPEEWRTRIQKRIQAYDGSVDDTKEEAPAESPAVEEFALDIEAAPAAPNRMWMALLIAAALALITLILRWPFH